MRNAGIGLENIEELRRRQGIEDVELLAEIGELHVGDSVKLTFLTGTTTLVGETLLVRITRIRGYAFRGKLAAKPVSPGLSKLALGTPLDFTTAHIHSIAKGEPAPD